MTATLATKPIRVPGTKWMFSMNPGPFNIKEHILTTIFATSSFHPPTSADIMIIMKDFLSQKVASLNCITTGPNIDGSPTRPLAYFILLYPLLLFEHLTLISLFSKLYFVNSFITNGSSIVCKLHMYKIM